MKQNNYLFYGYPLLLFAVSVVLILSDNFQFPNGAFLIILRQSSILGLLCLGLSLVILSGGIDLSIGALLSLSSSICSFVLFHYPNHIFLAVLLSLAFCTLCGLLNGFLIAHLHFPAAIITFSQALIYTGLSSLNQQWISTLNVPSFFSFFNGVFLKLPVSAIFFVLLLMIFSLCMHNTYWGQYLYAIGANEQALLSIGINTKYYKIATYAICGMLSGLAGIFMLARISSVSISINSALVLETLTSISLAGIGFSGAHGKLPGLLIGTVTVAALKVCMTVYAVPSVLQSFLIAVSFLGSLLIGRVIKTK